MQSGLTFHRNTGTASLIAIFLLVCIGGLTINAYAQSYQPVPSGYSSRTIQVKFRQGIDISMPAQLLSPELRRSVASITRLFSGLSKEELDSLKALGETNRGEALPDLNLWFKIILEAGTNAPEFLEKLKQLESVEAAQHAPLPPPMPAFTPDFTSNQGYLGEATDGIEARYSWTVPGGNGSGVQIYDVEYSWNQSHEDLTTAHGVALLLDPGDSADDPFDDDNHGTAVLGEIVADNDGKGVTGISWGADVGLAPANTIRLGYNPAHAILLAAANGSPGDVILLEQQVGVCNLGFFSFGPSEWVDSVFDAIRTAVANGFVVVEAAGNGGVNLDQPACGGKFDRTVRDSGAIIVGAGGSPTSGIDRRRLSFSSFGSRVDLQGWGDSVMTTGYGFFYRNLDEPTNLNFWYTRTFNGTSSASPFITGAAANLQGIALKLFEGPFAPSEIRNILVETGSPQLGNTVEHIGPRPNLRSAIARLTSVVNQLVSFVPIESSFRTTSNTAGCPAGFAGKFTFDAKLASENSSPVAALMTKVTHLTSGNLLQNADDGPGGVGATLTIPNADGFTDGILSPGEFVDVPFVICLKEFQPFEFFVDVFGIEARNADNLLAMR